ncbi:MAG: hypothetical protein V3W34_10140 [Phycisphaerae bacterium]
MPRFRALERALMRLVPGGFLLFVSYRVLMALNFSASGISNRITEYSITVVILPLAIAGLVLVLRGLRWLAMAFWPGRLCIVADADALTFDLGPMGRHRYPTDRLDVRYLFEMPGDFQDEGKSFEAYLDPRQQMEELLPRIRFPGEPDALEERITYYAPGTEKQLAETFRPFVEYMRRDRNDPPQDDD